MSEKIIRSSTKGMEIDIERPSSSNPPDSKGSISFTNQSHESSSISERRLITKIDLRILPILCAMYLFAFLDRVNIGNAQVFGLSKELKLKGVEYNVALCIFFIPYIIFELPSNILLKKFKPHVFLSVCMFLFGVMTIIQGFVKSYAALLATRFFLGFFETGIFPGCFYLLAMWYKREESQKRFTFFFLSTALAGAFGGLLASGIGKMDGVRGYLAWRWIFIIEGVLTCCVGILCLFTIPDFPEDVKWLSEDERRFVKQRLQNDVGKSGKATPVTAKDIMVLFTDYRFIVGGFMYFGFMVSAYGFSYFAPTIIKAWKFNAIETQLRTVPIWVVAFCVSMIFAWASDRTKHRYAFILAAIALAAIGYIMLLTIKHNIPAQYGALFLALSGTLSAMPITVCWFNTNLAGHNRRAIGSAFQVAFGNLGGILATFLFLAKDAPKYVHGYSVAIACLGVSLISSTIYFMSITAENKKRDKNQGLVQEDGEDLGDLAANFRYLR